MSKCKPQLDGSKINTIEVKTKSPATQKPDDSQKPPIKQPASS